MATRVKLSEEAKTARLAMLIVPASQVANGRFSRVDVANHSEADQRHMIRSGERLTIKRTGHVSWMVNRRIINPRQGQVCQWYADQHEAGFEVSNGCTANYCGAGGSGMKANDLLARHRAQFEARSNYNAARKAISPILLPLFERVVIGQQFLGRLTRSFRLAVEQLDDAIGHLVIER